MRYITYYRLTSLLRLVSQDTDDRKRQTTYKNKATPCFESARVRYASQGMCYPLGGKAKLLIQTRLGGFKKEKARDL